MSRPAQQHDLPRVIITPSSPPLNSNPLLSSHPVPHPIRVQCARPKAHRSYTTPEYSTKHLYPPSSYACPLPSAKSGRRPLRSPLYSLAMLLVGLMLIASSVMCAGESAEALLEMEQKGLRRLGDVGRGVGARLGWESGGTKEMQEEGQEGELPIVLVAESVVTEDEGPRRVYMEEGWGADDDRMPMEYGLDTERGEESGAIETQVEEPILSGEPSEL
ncbi:hypothetical protein IAR50_003824 [Cryptococcus sp. DSM 104548]